MIRGAVEQRAGVGDHGWARADCSFGTDCDGNERPPNTSAAGACFRPQNLTPVCQ